MPVAYMNETGNNVADGIFDEHDYPVYHFPELEKCPVCGKDQVFVCFDGCWKCRGKKLKRREKGE